MALKVIVISQFFLLQTFTDELEHMFAVAQATWSL